MSEASISVAPICDQGDDVLLRTLVNLFFFASPCQTLHSLYLCSLS